VKFLQMATGNYLPFLKLSQLYIVESKYDPPVTYDLGGLGFGTPWELSKIDSVGGKKISTGVRVCLTKPEVILNALKVVDDGEILAYLDTDTLLLDRIDELEDEEFDFGFTWQGSKKGRGYCNAGVIFVRKTKASIRFLKKWINNIHSDVEGVVKRRGLRSLGDQIFLNELIDKKLGVGSRRKGTTQKVLGAKVKFLNIDIYNCRKRRFSDATKILHVLGNKNAVGSKFEIFKKVESTVRTHVADKEAEERLKMNRSIHLRTICEVLREIYHYTEDPAIQAKVLEATQMAKKMDEKLRSYNKKWANKFFESRDA